MTQTARPDRVWPNAHRRGAQVTTALVAQTWTAWPLLARRGATANPHQATTKHTGWSRTSAHKHQSPWRGALGASGKALRHNLSRFRQRAPATRFVHMPLLGHVLPSCLCHWGFRLLRCGAGVRWANWKKKRYNLSLFAGSALYCLSSPCEAPCAPRKY
jgi:hypothetical protein